MAKNGYLWKLFLYNGLNMKISSYISSASAGWRIFPNAFDYIIMLVWVSVSQLIVVGCGMLMGLRLPDLAAVASADADISLTAELDTARTLMLVYAPSMLLSIGGILLYRRLRGGRGRTVRFSVAGFNPALILWGVVWMLATDIVIEPLLMLLPPIPDTVGRGFFALSVTVLVAPVCEEVLCRGIVLESLRAKYGVISAWIFSSLFFAVIHGQITSMVNALVLGSILGYICIRSRSIFSAILLHAINNALALTMISFGLGDSTFSSMMPDERIRYTVYGVSLLICIIGLADLVSGLRRERLAEKAE